MKQLSLVAESVEELAYAHQSETDSYSFEYVQLERGALSVTYEGVRAPETSPGLPALESSHEAYSRRLQLLGTTPRITTGVGAVLSPVPVRWNGVELGRGELLLLRPGETVDYIFPAGAEVLDLHLDPSLANAISACTEADLEHSGILRPPPAVWRSFTRAVLDWLDAPDPSVSVVDAKRSCLTSALIESTTQALVQSHPQVESRRVSRRHWNSIVRVARDWIHATLDRPITTAELCEATRSKARLLQLAFRELYGISPIAYQNRARLHAARADLLRADPVEASVTRIAHERGFSHLGRFSIDYRELFGESPSVTLGRLPARLPRSSYRTRPSAARARSAAF
jgi:AraC-like DNA-binding protein